MRNARFVGSFVCVAAILLMGVACDKNRPSITAPSDPTPTLDSLRVLSVQPRSGIVSTESNFYLGYQALPVGYLVAAIGLVREDGAEAIVGCSTLDPQNNGRGSYDATLAENGWMYPFLHGHTVTGSVLATPITRDKYNELLGQHICYFQKGTTNGVPGAIDWDKSTKTMKDVVTWDGTSLR